MTTAPHSPTPPKYRNPVPTVDVIIEIDGGVVLIERQNPPHGWALPGGFVDYGEQLALAAAREALEETTLTVTLTELLHIYSRPDRDPRQHTISTVYIGHAHGQQPQGADDAKQARVFPLDALPPNMAFDHAQILADYIHYKKTGQRPALNT
jgi:8-oxo-dGTP diphosphatase